MNRPGEVSNHFEYELNHEDILELKRRLSERILQNGALELLPYYGFLHFKDKIWQGTVLRIESSAAKATNSSFAEGDNSPLFLLDIRVKMHEEMGEIRVSEGARKQREIIVFDMQAGCDSKRCLETNLQLWECGFRHIKRVVSEIYSGGDYCGRHERQFNLWALRGDFDMDSSINSDNSNNLESRINNDSNSSNKSSNDSYSNNNNNCNENDNDNINNLENRSNNDNNSNNKSSNDSSNNKANNNDDRKSNSNNQGSNNNNSNNSTNSPKNSSSNDNNSDNKSNNDSNNNKAKDNDESKSNNNNQGNNNNNNNNSLNNSINERNSSNKSDDENANYNNSKKCDDGNNKNTNDDNNSNNQSSNSNNKSSSNHSNNSSNNNSNTINFDTTCRYNIISKTIKEEIEIGTEFILPDSSFMAILQDASSASFKSSPSQVNGYSIRTMSMNETLYAIKHWKYADEASLLHFSSCSCQGLAVGAFPVDSVSPVSWAFVSWDGAIAALQTLPEHRGKGLGKAVVKNISEILLQRSLIPYVFIEDIETSFIPCSLFTSLGFEVYKNYHYNWLFLNC